MTKIAIMQPYFIPYAGYFRLFVDVDVFVALDTAQYTKGSWINRNRLTNLTGALEWFNAPFARPPLGTPIAALEMLPDADTQIRRRSSSFPACIDPSDAAQPVVEQILSTEDKPSVYLIDILKVVMKQLNISAPIIAASTIPIDNSLRGADRIYAICEHMQSNVYYNAPGGASLYSKEEFAKQGIELKLHPPYRGPIESILERLHCSDPVTVKREIESNMG